MLREDINIAHIKHGRRMGCMRGNLPLTFAIYLVLGECDILQLNVNACCSGCLPQIFV